jgi:DNA polymerase zeta
MTTFEAVSAHWPRQPKTRSTQRSKRSANASSAHQASSPANLASSPPLPFKPSPTSPPSATRVGSPPDGVKVEDDLNAHVPVYPAIQLGIAEDSDSDEEENPFDALNMTQRMPDDVIEVNPSYIQRNMPLAQDEEEEDDPDPDRIRQLHEQDAQKHAEESARVRATQVHRLDEDQRSEYDDEEIDELFRQTINGGLSTPKKSQRGGSVTPTSGGSSGSTLAFRRARRDQRLREQAGLGDLRCVNEILTLNNLMKSIIMDRSSISLSPSKPLNDNLSTPTKTHMQPPSEKVTPNSMLRNMFARNRPSYSPQASPSKPPTYPGNGTPKTVVLTPSKRSAQGWQSPSPEPELEDQPEGSPTPTKTPMKHTFQEVKQELKEIEASDEKQMNIQAGQIVKSSKSSGDSNSNGHRSEAANINGGAKREMSPTLKNDEQSNPFLTLSGSKGSTGEAGDGSTPRAKKRLRMASPEARDKPHSQLVSTQTLLPTPPHLALSQMSIPSNPTDDSTSTVPSHLSSTAWTYRSIPPSRAQIATSMEEFGVDSAIYTDPHYSNRADIPPRAKMFAGRMFTLRGNGLKEMDEFESSLPIKRDKGKNTRHRQTPKHSGWEYAPLPPRSQAVISWCAEQDALDAEKGGLDTA